jgi:type II secretory pathway pseudopilin PulG
MQHSLYIRQAGSTLVEVLVAVALTGIMLPTLATALVTSHAGRATSQQQLQATGLLHEAAEAVYAAQQSGWANVATNGIYHPVVSNNGWELGGGPETADGFTRQVVISSAQRNGAGALVQSGGTDDPATRHAAVTISWTTPYDGAVSSDMYLTRWQGNAQWNQTTQADFTGATLSDTLITNTAGGEVELASAAAVYRTSGTFESSTFDAGATAAFNRLTFTAVQPAATQVTLQIAVNADNSTWDYVGPDGTAATYFTASAPVPLNAANGRYVRYKAFLSGPGAATPVVSDVTVNYSL